MLPRRGRTHKLSDLGMTRRHDAGIGADVSLTHHLLGVPTLGVCGHGDGGPRRARSRRAAAAVQVRLVLGGGVHMDHQVDAVDVNATSGDVGGHQDARGSVGERGQVALAFL